MERQRDDRALVDGMPGGHPRSSGAEIIRLPLLYLRAIFTPGARFFAAEGERARWGLVWLQIALLILIPGILGFLRSLDRSAAARDATNSQALADLFSALTVSTTLFGLLVQILFVPLLFFFGLTVEFLIARAFSGQGRFVWQGHAALLYQVPLAIISSVVSTIFLAIHLPLAARLSLYPIINLALFIYSLLLNIMAIEGVHRLTRGRSTLVVIVTYAVFALLIILLIVALARVIVSALHRT